MQVSVTGPFGGKSRFELVDLLYNLSAKHPEKTVGTYGTIRGARYFMVGIIQPSLGTVPERRLEDFSFLFEQLHLFARDLGLVTVWLGGTFKRSLFGHEVHVKGAEYIPAVSPVGYAASNRSYLDTYMRWVTDSDSRKPWQELFYEQEFGTVLTEKGAGKYVDALEMVRLAPSSRNGQPWRVVKNIHEPIFHFYVRRQGSSPFPDHPRLDVGIAMCHFTIANEEQGLTGTWTIADPENQMLPEGMQYVASWIGNP